MKYFYSVIVLIATLTVITPASAQITIDKVDTQKESVTFKNEIKSTAVDAEFFNRARYRAERAAIRKKRNYLEIGGGLQGTLTSYSDSWIATSGGDNSIALIASMFLRHTFSKNLFFIETKFNAKMGYNRMKVETVNEEGSTSDGVWFKNQDEFQLSIAPSFKMSKNWSYGAIFKFRSQFINGYKSRTEQKDEFRKSGFMTPGYLDISFGITYKSPKPRFPIVINLSPLAVSATYVHDEQIRKNKIDGKFGWQVYGLENENESAKYEGGSSIQIDFDRTFGKKEIFRYRTTLFSFIGWITNMGLKNKISNYTDFAQAMNQYNDWKEESGTPRGDKPHLSIHPTIRWENVIDIRATKYLSTSFSFQLYYNRAQNLDVQTQMLLSVGLTYTFKNK
ncbi:MAG: DUF3078 domain-containing protein [Alistipes sp.]